MPLQLKISIAALVLLALIDSLWKRLSTRDRVQDRLLPALAAYVLLAVGLTCFVLSWVPSWIQALGWGGVLGLVIFGVHGFTDLRTWHGARVKMAVVGMTWGTVLCAATSALLYGLRAWLE